MKKLKNKDAVENIENSAEVILDYHNKTNFIQSFSTLEEAAPYIIKAERNSRHGHQGRLFLFRRGIYSTMMVKALRIHDAIKLFDQHIGSYQLCNLRMQVFSKNVFY